MMPSIQSSPLLRHVATSAKPTFIAAGAWTALNAGRIDGLIDDILGAVDCRTPVLLDMAGVTEFDTYGASMQLRLVRACGALGGDVQVTGLAERFQGLVQAVGQAKQLPAARDRQPRHLLSSVEALGRATVDIGRDFVGLLNMLGAAGHALAGVAMRRSTFRLTSTVHHVDRVAWQAVPIILLITFLIGGIIAQQGFFHFRKFGADQYVVDMVGILVLREIGVLIVAIMVAGRSGSSYTAELGSMKMREEIDALRTMGLDPIAVLILPRVIALVIALPILTFLGSMSALLGGGFVAWVYGDMNPDIFIARLKDAISHFKVGMIKAPFMALVIGIVACSEGFKVRGSAESLGLQTTASVVKSIFLVIVLDGLFAMYFASIGM